MVHLRSQQIEGGSALARFLLLALSFLPARFLPKIAYAVAAIGQALTVAFGDDFRERQFPWPWLSLASEPASAGSFLVRGPFRARRGST